ncbi:cell surface A33 antigen [Melospiza melodia melodia]|uniref:cell surface A33 antigen n=1 Tax=Melospiza melodia melodia TaxID=1914991 RepID=UPI002FD5DAC7
MRGTATKGLGLLIFSAILVSAHALTVEAPERQIQVARGRDATLRCNFRTNSAIDRGDLVVWKKIDSKVDAVTRYFDGLLQFGEGYDDRLEFNGDVDGGDISVTMGAVTMEDNGTYVCSVRLRADPPRQSALVDLFVLVAPSKPECKIVGTPEYGQTINLTCASQEGSPAPKYTWKSFNVQNEPRPLAHTEGQKITLKNISADTSGFYICTSTNSVGTEFCNMTVSVVPPSMNIALYAGIIGGVVAAIVVVGIIAYCCCCRESKDTDYEMTAQEDRNEPSRQMPPRHENEGEYVENEENE